jgi:hypothetical protein
MIAKLKKSFLICAGNFEHRPVTDYYLKSVAVRRGVTTVTVDAVLLDPCVTAIKMSLQLCCCVVDCSTRKKGAFELEVLECDWFWCTPERLLPERT